MEIQDSTAARPASGTAGRAGSERLYRPPTQTAASDDSVATYVGRTFDMNTLSGDIQKIVTAHIQNSIPDDRKLMLELVNQVSELTNEVKQLRQQLDSKPSAVYSCPTGQLTELSGELAEIKALLHAGRKPQGLSAADLDSILLETALPQNAERPPTPPTPPPPEPEPAERAEPLQETADAPTKPEKKKKTILSILGNVLFYLVIIGVVGGAFLAKSSSGGSPTVIAGYSAFTVLSSSMEDTYPKGALIVTKSVDPNDLKIGDDITYMASATSSITHRIIGITENYLDTGARAFETQGTMNEKPDKEPVAAANVVGKVIFCSVLLGNVISFASANWILLVFFVVVLAALFVFLKWNFRREDEPAESKPPKKRKH